jgi:Flp pilus assembly pilin Flp
MLNRKGQGLTEYGIILLLVVLVGTGIWFSGVFGNDVQGMYSTIGSKLNSIAGDDSGIYDTGEIGKLKDGTVFHVTSLSHVAYSKTVEVAWYLDSAGHKTYFLYYPNTNITAQYPPASNSVMMTNLQGYNKNDGGQAVWNKTDNSLTTYFYNAQDAQYYKVTAYYDNIVNASGRKDMLNQNASAQTTKDTTITPTGSSTNPGNTR